MQSGIERQTLAHRAATLAALCGIALITLFPTADARDHNFALCLACGEYGTLDLLLNIALFVPLGALLSRPESGYWTVARAALLGAAFSLAIEGVQLLVPGRDPSLSDLFGNSLGALLGATGATARARTTQVRPRVWLWLSCGWVVLSAGALAFGVWAVGFEVPYRGYYVQWEPRRTGYAPFLGKVAGLSLNNIKLNPDDAFSPWLLPVSFFHGQIKIIADIAPGPRPDGMALIARLALPDGEFMMIGRQGDALVARYRANAYRAGLRSPIFAFPANLADNPQAVRRFRIEKRRDEIALRASSAGLTSETSLRISAARVWATLLPFNRGFGRLGVVSDLFFLGLLFGPAAYAGARTRMRWSGLVPLTALAGWLVALTFGWQPALWWWPYWAASAMGAAAGYWLGLRPHTTRLTSQHSAR